MNDWVTGQLQTIKHRVAVYLFAIIVFLSYFSPVFFEIGLVVFFLITSFKMLKKMLLFMLVIGVISALIPFLAPIVVIVMVVLFIMRIGYVIKNWKPFVGGFVVYGGSGVIIARTSSLYYPAFIESIIVSVLAFFMLHYLLKWLYKSGYSSDTALGIMGSVPLIILSFVLPFLKLHISGLETGHAPADSGFHPGEAVMSPDGHMVHSGEAATAGANLQQVHSYVRTAPDGDLTNNLSYHGPDAKPPDMNDLVQVNGYVRTAPDGVVTNNLSYHGADVHSSNTVGAEVASVPAGAPVNDSTSHGLNTVLPSKQYPAAESVHEKVIDISQKSAVGQAAVDSMVRGMKSKRNE